MHTFIRTGSLPKYNQGQLKEEDSLLALQKQALFIPRSSIQNLQPIGQGIQVHVGHDYCCGGIFVQASV